jgi:rhodanese-related sulfurtransferase
MKLKGMKTLIAIAAALAGFFLFQSPQKDRQAVTVKEARAMIATDTTLLVLDVRTPAEYSGELGHIRGSILIPIQELDTRLNELEVHKGKTILAICRTGRRSGIATEMLLKNGYRAMNVEGGMVAWNAEKFDVEK